MATGFANRWLGKVLAKTLWIGSGGITLASLTGSPTVSPADLLGVRGQSTVTIATTTAAMRGYGLDTIAATSALAVYPLGDPTPGVEKYISILQNSSGVMIKANTAGVSFDPSTNTVIKSTITGQIGLIGISTVAYRIQSWYGPTSTAATLTLSTTT